MKTLLGPIAAVFLASTASADCRSDDLHTQIEQCSVVIAERTSDDDVGVAYLYRCQAYDQLKLYDRAVADCERAAQIIPQDSSVYNSLSIIEQNRQNLSAAISHANRAIQLNPDNAGNFNTRANAYCAAGQFDRSVQDRVRAMELGRYTPEWLQKFLTDRGHYTGPIDGKFGMNSRQALARWTRAGC